MQRSHSIILEHGIVPDIRHTAKNFGEHLGVDKKSAKTKLFLMFPYIFKKTIINPLFTHLRSKN
jgi:hypothetical protein